MANKDNNLGCVIIVIIGFIIGTIIFRVIFTNQIWDRVLNAPVEAMAATNSICLWLVLCIGCSWLVGKIWSSSNK